MIFDKLSEPKEENVNQIQLYLHYFKVPRGILLYVNKNTLTLKEFIVEYSQERALSLLASLAETKKKIDAGEIPARLLDYPGNWQCRYCQFQEICGMTGKGELKWEAFKEKVSFIK